MFCILLQQASTAKNELKPDYEMLYHIAQQREREAVKTACLFSGNVGRGKGQTSIYNPL